METNKLQNQRVLAILNFAYFIYNFPHDFIEKVWSDNSNMAEHLRSKFTARCKGAGYCSAGNFMDWFMDLSDGYRTDLLVWIEKNYRAQSSFSSGFGLGALTENASTSL